MAQGGDSLKEFPPTNKEETMDKPQTAVEALKAARELISDPKRWTQHHFSATTDGTPCDSQDPDARRFCALGAILRVRGVPLHADRYLDEAGKKLFGMNVDQVNDTLQHDDVLQMFDKAIQLAEAERV